MILNSFVSLDQKRSFRFYKYLFSYILVAAILLVIVSSIVYGNIFSSLQKEVESSNINSLNQLMDMMNNRLQEMERISLQIVSNPRLAPSMIGNGGYDAAQAVKELQNYNSSTVFVYDIILYYKYKHNDKIFASSGFYSLDAFFSTRYQFESFNVNGLMEAITSANPVMRSAEKVTVNQVNNTSFLYYIYPIPPNSSSPFGSVVFMIEDKTMQTMIQNMLGNRSGLVYILDTEKQPLVCVYNNTPDPEESNFLDLINSQSSSDTVSSIDTDFGKYSIVRLSSGYNKWEYVVAMPTGQFMETVYKSRNAFNVTIFVVFAIGLLLAFIFATNTYKPIKKMANLLQDQNRVKELSEYNDEIAFITKAIDRVTDKNKSLMHSLHSKNFLMKEQFLLNLLKGEYKSVRALKNDEEVTGINIPGDYFTVLLFVFDDYNSFKHKYTKAVQNLYKFSIVNVIEELSAEFGIGYAIDLLENSGIALLLFMRHDCERDIQELAVKAKGFFYRHFEFTLTVGIGNTYDSVLMMQQSFVEANRALFYRLIKGKNNIIFYRNLNISIEKNDYKYPVKYETELVSSIRQGKVADIENITKSISDYIEKQPLSPEAVQCMCFGIINTVLKTLDEMNISADTDLSNEMIGLFSKFETLDGLVSHMVEFSGKVCAYIESQKESKNYDLRDKIINYICENYSKDGLSLEMIADEFGLSSSYITRFFKNQTGYSLMKYVDKLRIEKAKELLTCTDLTIKKIIEKIGYINETNFIRKFKSYEGVTPNQYRKLPLVSLEKLSGN